MYVRRKLVQGDLSDEQAKLDALFAELQGVAEKHEFAKARPDLLPEILARLSHFKKELSPFVNNRVSVEQFPPMKDVLRTRLETISFTTFQERIRSKPPSAADTLDTRITKVLERNFMREIGDLITVRNVGGQIKLDQLPVTELQSVSKKTEMKIEGLLRSRFNFESALSLDEIEILRAYKLERAIKKVEEAIRILETRVEKWGYWDYNELLKILNAELEKLDNISISHKQMERFQEKLAEFKKRFGPSQL